MSKPEIDLDQAPVAEKGAIGVPVIDIGDLRDGKRNASLPSVRAIADACCEWGFFQVINHGIADDIVDDMWAQTRSFFGWPQAEKEALMRTRENPWGYYNNELTKNQRDKKEVFDFTVDGRDPVYEAENRWPRGRVDFRHAMRRYRDACADLSLTLLEAMCSGLGLEPQFLNEHFSPSHTGFIRLNYYPVRDPLAGRSDVQHLETADLGVHHHTDAGALTVLLQDDVGGLQVFNNDRWHDVEPEPGAFVINTGDMMQVWSNDRYRAAIHRVLAMQEVDRYSIPFFYDPDAGTEVRPLPSVVTDESPALYRSVNWSDFRYKRTDGDYADYGTEVQISQYRQT